MMHVISTIILFLIYWAIFSFIISAIIASLLFWMSRKYLKPKKVIGYIGEISLISLGLDASVAMFLSIPWMIISVQIMAISLISLVFIIVYITYADSYMSNFF